MRMLLVAIVVLGSAFANASPLRPGVIWGGARHASPGAQPLAQVSNVLHLNDCLPGGCTVRPGVDDSRTDTSSIPEQVVTLSGWNHGPEMWDAFVQCVKVTYAPFDIEVVTDDPGAASHFEVMIGGRATQLHPELDGAGGVAPFLACGATENNTISFVFAEDIPNVTFLCHAAAQESAHVWGLDHELDPKDPMTYLEPGTLKRFQDNAANCGESSPRECSCGGATQNSMQYLLNTFGPGALSPPSMAIESPVNGAWVLPGFAVRARPMSQLDVTEASLLIDGASAQTMASGPYVFEAPAMLAGGTHVVAVTAKDSGGRVFDDSITVNVTPACGEGAGCPNDLNCLGGFCLPGVDVPGGLGATCATGDECITGTCGVAGEDQLCTAACDAGGVCPSGFACATTSNGSGVCWPGDRDDGGCATTDGSPGMLVLGLAFAFAIGRRRRS